MPRYPARNALLGVALRDPSPALSLHDTPEVATAKRTLRTSWKWAFVSHFIFVFEPMLGLRDDVTVSDLENDLAAGTAAFTPRVIIRLLTMLTHDRKITVDNYQRSMYRQFLKRAPEYLPTLVSQADIEKHHIRSRSPSATNDDGTPAEDAPEEVDEDLNAMEENIEWLSLTMEQKLDCLHQFCEWQFMNPTRLRLNMKTDDDYATWRIEPIGYDSTLNSYYLLGGDRIWVQRTLPKKSRKKSKPKPKAKPTPKISIKAKAGGSSSKSKAAVNPKKRAAPVDLPEASTRSSKRIKKQESPSQSPAPAAAVSRSGRPSRAAATDANRKMAALPQATMNPRSTRASARIRGATEDEVWQEIPEEWLNASDRGLDEDGEGEGEVNGVMGGSELTELSELSELSDVDDEETKEAKYDTDDDEDQDEDQDVKAESVEPDPEPEVEAEPEPVLPVGFIEWETLVITMQEWETFPLQFEKSKHYLEKNFYKTLTATGSMVQAVIKEKRDDVKRRITEEALAARKRSSRIAHKEVEKEEARAAALKRAEEDEKLDRARRAEMRARKEEDARKKREDARAERHRALEEAKTASTTPVDVVGPVVDEKLVTPKKAYKKKPKTGPKTPIRRANGASTGAAEDWELDCEMCGMRGINLNDGTEITCCELCGKWQHVWCHDQNDDRAGRPRRNWDKVEFRCFDCGRTRRGAPAPPAVAVRAAPYVHRPQQQQQPQTPSQTQTQPQPYPLHAPYAQTYDYQRWPSQNYYPTMPNVQQHPQPAPQLPNPQPQPAGHLNSYYTNANYGVLGTTNGVRQPYYSPQVPGTSGGGSYITFAPNVSAESYKTKTPRAATPNGTPSRNGLPVNIKPKPNAVAIAAPPPQGYAPATYQPHAAQVQAQSPYAQNSSKLALPNSPAGMAPPQSHPQPYQAATHYPAPQQPAPNGYAGYRLPLSSPTYNGVGHSHVPIQHGTPSQSQSQPQQQQHS